MAAGIHAFSKKKPMKQSLRGCSAGYARIFVVLLTGTLLIVGGNETIRRATRIGMERTSNAVCFAVDCSISMIGEPLSTACNGVQRSLMQLPNGMEAALVEFQKEARTVVPCTTDYRLITEALSELKATGTTGISEGIREAEKNLSAAGGTRSIILFTDGKNGEERIAPEVADDLKENKTALFLIGLFGTEGANLKQIAEDSGGSFSTLQEGLDAAVSGVVYRAQAGRNLRFAIATILELLTFWGIVLVIAYRGRRGKRKEPQSGSLPNAGYLKREEVKKLV